MVAFGCSNLFPSCFLSAGLHLVVEARSEIQDSEPLSVCVCMYVCMCVYICMYVWCMYVCMYVCVCVCVCECDSSRQSVFWSSVFILPSPPCPPPHHVLPGDCENQYVGHWRRLSLVVVVRGILYPLWCRKRQTPFMHNLVLCCRQPLSSSPGCVLEPLHHYTTRLSGKFLRVYRLPLQPVPLSWVVLFLFVCHALLMHLLLW